LLNIARDYIRTKLNKVDPGFTPNLALVLGSGMGELINDVFDENPLLSIPYADISFFPKTRAGGHAGKLTFGHISGVPVVVQEGRKHYNEVGDMPSIAEKIIASQVYILHRLGIVTYFATNAAGGISENGKAGELMLINSHFNMLRTNAMIGAPHDHIGPWFPSLHNAYTPQLLDLARKVGDNNPKIHLGEGTYCFTPGPVFETRLDVRILQTLGVDAIGMSTVLECEAATYADVKFMAVSGIANFQDGVKETEHEDVLAAGRKIIPQFTHLVRDFMGEYSR